VFLQVWNDEIMQYKLMNVDQLLVSFILRWILLRLWTRWK